MRDGTFVRIGAAPRGSTPFVTDAAGTRFDGQGGRRITFGHTFSAERGYRAFFKFEDSEAANTWGGEGLLAWCDFKAEDAGARKLQADARTLANQVIALNREWHRQGRPRDGLQFDQAGHG